MKFTYRYVEHVPKGSSKVLLARRQKFDMIRGIVEGILAPIKGYDAEVVFRNVQTATISNLGSETEFNSTATFIRIPQFAKYLRYEATLGFFLWEEESWVTALGFHTALHKGIHERFNLADPASLDNLTKLAKKAYARMKREVNKQKRIKDEKLHALRKSNSRRKTRS